MLKPYFLVVAAIVQDGYESSKVLMVLDDNPKTEWIMDSGCSWYMTPNRYVRTLKIGK